MTGYESKRAAAQDKLAMTKDDALRLALEALESIEWHDGGWGLNPDLIETAITAIKEALAQPAQEPVAYDKTEMNGFVQDLYDKKMQEGKHGHYETMFHVVHQAIKRATPPQRKPLTDEQLADFLGDEYHTMTAEELRYFRLAEAAHDIKE